MGTSNSKPKFIGGPKFNSALNTDADKPPGAAAAAAAPTEADLAMKDVNKWKQFMADIVALPEAKDTIKTEALEDKAAKSDLAKKGIVANKDNVKKFVSADRDFLPDVILYIKGTGLADTDKTPLKLELAEAEKNAEGTEDAKKLKAGTKFDAVKPIFESIVKATRVAKKHSIFRKIIVEYVARLKTFEKFMKSENISGAKDAITSGEKGAVKNAKEEIKGKQEGGEDPPVPQGGPPLQPPIEGQVGGGAEGAEEEKEGDEEGAEVEGDGSGEAEEGEVEEEEGEVEEEEGEVEEEEGEEEEDGSGGDGSSIGSDTSGFTDPDVIKYGGELIPTDASVGGSDEEEPFPETGGQGGVPLSGGLNVIGFRSDEDKLKNKRDKDYKNFKKEARGDFKKKMTAFFADNEAMAAFMDENEQTLLEMVYNGKIPGKWIDKSKETEKATMVEALVTAINKYTPKEEKKEGAEGAPAGEAAPPGDKPAGDGKDATAEGKAYATAEGKADATAGDEAGKADAPGAAGKKAEPPAGDKQPPEGGQGGGGKIKKKKFTRRKPRHINIRINVGDKNVNTNDSSSSDSSSSSSDSDDGTSSSSSSSDDSSSDDSSDEEERTVKKRKYTRRNKTRA
jgi:hypothetical protein